MVPIRVLALCLFLFLAGLPSAAAEETSQTPSDPPPDGETEEGRTACDGNGTSECPSSCSSDNSTCESAGDGGNGTSSFDAAVSAGNTGLAAQAKQGCGVRVWTGPPPRVDFDKCGIPIIDGPPRL